MALDRWLYFKPRGRTTEHALICYAGLLEWQPLAWCSLLRLLRISAKTWTIKYPPGSHKTSASIEMTENLFSEEDTQKKHKKISTTKHYTTVIRIYFFRRIFKF
jgi:hypothetical protein